MADEEGTKSPRSRSPAMGVSGLRRDQQKYPSTTGEEEGGRRSSGGILRLEPGKPRRRSSVTSVELRAEAYRMMEGDPASPCPSDRLSVTWADGERSLSSDTSVVRVKEPENPSIATLLPNSMLPSPLHLPDKPNPVAVLDPSKLLPAGLQDDDDDLCASISVIMQRSSSKRQSQKRRGSSFRRRLTRSSTHTDSSAETVVDVEVEADVVRGRVRVYREVLTGVREQPWEIGRKLKLCRSARAYLAENEGAEEERLAQSTSTKDICYRHFRYARKTVGGGLDHCWNWFVSLELWYGRFKRIESHFGSAVASYFYFLRWVMGLNATLVVVTTAFVLIPEFLAASRLNTGERKFMLDEERQSGYDFKVIWNFEGMLRYSPFFYGYYSRARNTAAGYKVPEAYFLTFVMIFAFSFYMIIRKMAANQRMSKLSYDKTEFTWCLLGGWDYAIGNLEAAQNKVAAINMGFRELLQGAQEKEKSITGWRLVACRCLAHFLVLCLLASSAYAVVLLVMRSMEVDETFSWWRQNELSVILTLISQIYPNLFKMVSQLEYLLPRQEVQVQLARIMALNLLNLTTFTFTLYKNIKVMYDDSDKIKEELIAEFNRSQQIISSSVMYPDTILPLDLSSVGNIFSNSTAMLSNLAPFHAGGLNLTEAAAAAVTATTLAVAAAGYSHVGNVNISLNNSTPQSLDIGTPASRTRSCKKKAIPCATSSSVYYDDYLDFPNDTSARSANSSAGSERNGAMVASSSTAETIMELGGSSTEETLALDGYFSTVIAYPYLLNDTKVAPNDSMNGIAVDETFVVDETGFQNDFAFQNESGVKNETGFQNENSKAIEKGFQNETETVVNNDSSNMVNDTDVNKIFNDPVMNETETFDDNRNGGRMRRFSEKTDAYEVNYIYDDDQNHVGRIKRQNDYDHHFSANSYDTRLFNFVHEPTSTETSTTTLQKNTVHEPTSTESSTTTHQKSTVHEPTSTESSTTTHQRSTVHEPTSTESSTTTHQKSTVQEPTSKDSSTTTHQKRTTITETITSATTMTTRATEMGKSSANVDSVLDFDYDKAYFIPHSQTSTESTILSSLALNALDSAADLASPSEEEIINLQTINGIAATNEEKYKEEKENLTVPETGEANGFLCYTYVCEEDLEDTGVSFIFPIDINATQLADSNDDIVVAITMQSYNVTETWSTSINYTENVPAEATRSPSDSDQSSESIFGQAELREGEMSLFDLEKLVAELPSSERKKLRRLCWETAIGQEIIKITVMDLVVTVTLIFIMEYFRALVVRFMNFRNCCWDLERQFPGYAGFDIAENIFHLINNQGMVWMGMFFSPCLPILNLVKLIILLYVRSWAVVTSNVPPESVYKASDNNNFYLVLFLAMLFLCMLPVWFTMIWVPPSWHCGPFSDYKRIYKLFPFIDFISIPFFVIPVVLLLVLGIFYFVSLTKALREANEDLYEQLCHERNEERRKNQEAITGAPRTDTPTSRWNKLIPLTPLPGRSSATSIGAKLRASAIAVTGDDALRTPLLTDVETAQSPPADDTTDLGQSEVFDDSISEVKKVTYKTIPADGVKTSIKRVDPKKRENSVPSGHPRKKNVEDVIKLEKKPRERLESQDSAGSSLLKSPKYHQKNKQFSFPEIAGELPTQKEHFKRHRDSAKKKEAKLASSETPESANKEFVYKDYTRRDSRPSTPLMKPKHKKVHERRGSEESRRKQSPGKQAPELKESSAVLPAREGSIGSQERNRKDKTRSSIDRGSKHSDSPSRKRQSLRHKKQEPPPPPTVVVDLHGPDKEYDRKKRESLQNQEIEEKEDEMQTIPIIKISKEDSVERSIEQAKLDRQKAVDEDDFVDTIPMADDSDAPTVYEKPQKSNKITSNVDSAQPVQDPHKVTNSPELPTSISRSPRVSESPDLTNSNSPYVPDTSNVTDSPDLTNSLSTSTPSSGSRRTYTVPSHLESDADETSETFTLLEAERSQKPRDISVTPKVLMSPLASTPHTANSHGKPRRLNDASCPVIDDLDDDRVVETRDSYDEPDSEVGKADSYDKDKPTVVADSPDDLGDVVAPKAESEDDNLSNDDAEKHKK